MIVIDDADMTLQSSTLVVCFYRTLIADVRFVTCITLGYGLARDVAAFI
ncbi:hypothetical protein [Undibacter mobilis]|nr:hypothetical protein [Undibacter mobilis]